MLKSDVTLLGFRLADGESGRIHLRLLHQRSRHDPRLVQGRGHRAAAPGADSRVQGRAARAPCRPAHWDARSRARDPRSSPGPEIQDAEAVRARHGGGVRGARSRIRLAGFQRWTTPAPGWSRRPDDRGIEIRKLARPAPPASRLSEAHSRRGWRRTAACTFRPGCRSSMRRPSRGITRLPEIGARRAGGFFEGDRLRPLLGEIAERRSISRRRRPP